LKNHTFYFFTERDPRAQDLLYCTNATGIPLRDKVNVSGRHRQTRAWGLLGPCRLVKENSQKGAGGIKEKNLIDLPSLAAMKYMLVGIGVGVGPCYCAGSPLLSAHERSQQPQAQNMRERAGEYKNVH
jgi:hypothetical protein